MNLAFSEEQEAIRDEFRRVLESSSARAGLAHIEQAQGPCDEALWQTLGETGWLGASIAEAHGGSELGVQTLCVLAEEAGRQAAAVAFTASSCGFVTGLELGGDGVMQAEWLPRLAQGSATGIVLMPQDWTEAPVLDAQGRLHGKTGFVRDGAAATVALTRARAEDGECLAIVSLPEARERATPDRTLDLLHPPARFDFPGLAAVRLATADEAGSLWQRLLDHQALFIAFEQLGGAQAALQMAREYSLTRYAFGRAIGSFQALKHTMADMLCAIEIARSNCYFGAASLDADPALLSEAAAVAHISATEAYRLCARQNVQIHGGIGVTWESDAHLHYRRAQSLATALGTPESWKERLIQGLLRPRQAA